MHSPTTTNPGNASAACINANGTIVRRLSTSQFARRVGLSRDYIRQLCDTGELAGVKRGPRAGSHWAIPESELAKFEVAS